MTNHHRKPTIEHICSGSNCPYHEKETNQPTPRERAEELHETIDGIGEYGHTNDEVREQDIKTLESALVAVRQEGRIEGAELMQEAAAKELRSEMEHWARTAKNKRPHPASYHSAMIRGEASGDCMNLVLKLSPADVVKGSE